MNKRTYLTVYNEIFEKLQKLISANANTRDHTYFKLMDVVLRNMKILFNNGVKNIPICKVAVGSNRDDTYILFYLLGCADLDNLAHWDRYARDIVKSYPVAGADFADLLNFSVATTDSWDDKWKLVEKDENTLVCETLNIYTVMERELLLLKYDGHVQLVTMTGRTGVNLIHDLTEGTPKDE